MDPGEGCADRCFDFCGGADGDRPLAPPLACLPNPSHSELNICASGLMAAGQGLLLWQAPGGEPGTGPAIEILADGRVRQWKSTSPLRPHQTSDWDTETSVDHFLVAQLFALLNQVDYSRLPHNQSIQWECSPLFYYQPCPSCEPRVLEYRGADDLLPEMDAVYTWFHQHTLPDMTALPPSYCMFGG